MQLLHSFKVHKFNCTHLAEKRMKVLVIVSICDERVSQ